MITSFIASVSETTQRSGMGLVSSLKAGHAAWTVGKLAAKQPKAPKPAGLTDAHIAEVRRIAEERGLDIPANPSDW